MKLKAFTLVELLVVATIIVLMAVIAVPIMDRNQALAEYRNKTDELTTELEKMHVIALNAEQGKARYYAKATNNNGGKVDFGSWDGVSTGGTIYKTVTPSDNQTITDMSSNKYLVCDKGKSFCCLTTNLTDNCVTMVNGSTFFTLFNDDFSDSIFRIYSNPFRVTVGSF